MTLYGRVNNLDDQEGRADGAARCESHALQHTTALLKIYNGSDTALRVLNNDFIQDDKYMFLILAQQDLV